MKMVLLVIGAVIAYVVLGMVTNLVLTAVDDESVEYDESSVGIIVCWPIMVLICVVFGVGKLMAKVLMPIAKALSILPIAIIKVIQARGNSDGM